MNSYNRSSHLLLKLIYLALFPVFEAQEVSVLPEVTGYLGNDVTLQCQFLGPKDVNISQVQWVFLQPDGEKTNIIIFNSQFGVYIPESRLQGRVEIAEHSLVIRNVEMADKGSYTCKIAAFPSGSFEGTTNLVVREQMALSTGVVSAVVTVVVLLLVIIAAVVYLTVIRRFGSSVRHRVFIDTAGPVDVARPSVIVREEDVVYSDVKLKPSRDAAPSSNDKLADGLHADNVTYSEVVILRPQPK